MEIEQLKKHTLFKLKHFPSLSILFINEYYINTDIMRFFFVGYL